MLRGLICDGFVPFGKFKLEIPPVENKPSDLAEVHLITGVNGTGKTRLLSLLAGLLGNPKPLAERNKVGIAQKMVLGVTGKYPHDNLSVDQLMSNLHVSLGWGTAMVQQGNILWANAQRQPIQPWLTDVPAFAYRCSPYVHDTVVKSLIEVARPDRQQCLSFDHGSEISQPLLQAITNLKVQAAMESMESAHDGADTRSVKLVRALETTVSQITRTPFKFNVRSKPDVLLQVMWGNQMLAFSVLPDGLRSIIGWLVHALVMLDLWLAGKSDPTTSEAVFLLDEIEGHLHPAWQRRVLPAFQHLFPNSQVFVATHSPFVISSLNHGWIHCLAMQPDYSVKFEKPKPASEGSSYIAAVEEVMGVKEWYDDDSENLLKEFREKRDEAYRGVVEAEQSARALAVQIGERSMELGFMMGRELKQMDRQLKKPESK